MTEYEYLVIRAVARPCAADMPEHHSIEQWLNRLGSRGWQLVTKDAEHYYFTRRLHQFPSRRPVNEAQLPT